MAKSSGRSPATYFALLSCTVTLSATSADVLRKTGRCGSSATGARPCARNASAAANTFTTTLRPPAASWIPGAGDEAGAYLRRWRAPRPHMWASEGPKVGAVTGSEFVPRIRVALTSQMFQRVCRGDTADPAGDLQAPPGGESLQEPAAERVAHAGRIDDRARRNGRHRRDGGPLMDRAPFFTARDDERDGGRADRGFVEPGLLLHQLDFVVVADDDCRAEDPVSQLRAAHPRALLSGVPDERNAEGAAFLRVLDHRAGIVRRHDHHGRVRHRAEGQRPGVRHRAGVERGDLVALGVGAAEERRGELGGDRL